jgi:hypothetical protein
MESASDALRLTPAISRVRKSVQRNQIGKAMVVGLDYFALTSRYDTNVIFWPVGVAQANTSMPPKVSHLWISDFISDEARANLLRQAKSRNITVWKCSLVELRQRLLSFWGNPSNRSMVTPAESNGSDPVDERGELSLLGDDDIPVGGLKSITKTAATKVDLDEIEDRTGEEEDAIPKLRERSRFRKLTAKDRKKASRLKLLKQASRRVGSGAATKTIEHQPPQSFEAILQSCSMIDREVFLFHIKHCSCISTPNNGGGHSSVSIMETAREFGLGESNVRNSLERVWRKLPHSRLVHEEGSLEVNGNSVARD